MDELATDEHSVADIISQNLADGIGLKINKAGGLTRGRRMRDLCQASGLTMSVQDTVGSDISFAAICHLGATVNHSFCPVCSTRGTWCASRSRRLNPSWTMGCAAADNAGLGC